MDATLDGLRAAAQYTGNVAAATITQLEGFHRCIGSPVFLAERAVKPLHRLFNFRAVRASHYSYHRLEADVGG
jgi:hypothetical protein